MEQSGIPGWDENGDKGMIDAGETGELVAAAGLEDEAVLEDFMSALEDSPLRGMALRVLPLVRDGYERSEIAAQLGVAKPTVSRALTYIRDQFRRWYAN
jgi:DNA-binding NarL/FixJ family response regulator